MINRKIEILLTMLGIGVYVFLAISSVTIMNLRNDEEVATVLYEEVIEEIEAGEEIPTYTEFIETIKASGTISLVVAIISGIAGIVAILLLRGDKRPRTAGVLLLIVGVFNGFTPLVIALIGSIFYIIPAMMALFKKPKIV